MSIWPTGESFVQLPMGDAVARFQAWGGFVKSQPYALRVDTPHGTVSKELWTDWGPASTINLYRTPEDWLVGIGGGGDTVVIDVVDRAGPRIVYGSELDKTDDEKWIFLGYASAGGFVPASRMPECVELLGAGYTRYRKKYQNPHFCTFPIEQ
ncbi:hypothetical protein mvi_26120 [Methylobacterium indicum]|uniref:Uncharacterized protein n=1 Tax=Methylobacterium indicum TaxID=1775910 RepID=A0A8H9C6Y3_9HYPH|nr:hypothetical protein mvi_26120 [Methylobacterium indicum]